MSGAAPAEEPPAKGAAPPAPGFAISGVAGAGVPRATHHTITLIKTATTDAATIQAVCSDRMADEPTDPTPAATGRPHRWQNRARLDSSAPQWLQRRGPRLAPQWPQNVAPAWATAPQVAQLMDDGSVMPLCFAGRVGAER